MSFKYLYWWLNKEFCNSALPKEIFEEIVALSSLKKSISDFIDNLDFNNEIIMPDVALAL